MNELMTMLKGLPIWSYFAAGLIFCYYLYFTQNTQKTERKL